MRGVQRAVLFALLIGAGPVLAGCADFDMDKLDVFGLSNKPKLPGERHAVFPEGVPGVTQGIPPQLTKGHEGEQIGAAVAVEPIKPEAQPQAEQKTAAVSPAEAKPKPVRKRKVVHHPTRVKMTPEQAAAPAAQPAAQPAPQAAQPAQQQPAGGWPPPAAPAQGSAWPAPVPSGTFSKQ